MSLFCIKPFLPNTNQLYYHTPLLLGMEFSEKKMVIEDELDELEQIHCLNDWDFDLNCTEKYLSDKRKSIIITDTQQNITWTSRGFVRMTGYTYYEAFHQKPSFLQGPKTLQSTRSKIRETLLSGKVFEGDIVNYRKSGSIYTCNVTILPILNHHSQLVNFIALEEEK